MKNANATDEKSLTLKQNIKNILTNCQIKMNTNF